MNEGTKLHDTKQDNGERPIASPPAPEQVPVESIPIPQVEGQKIMINGLPYNREPYVGYKEVKDFTGYKYGYLRQLVMQEAIPYYKPRGKVSFLLSEIDEWMKHGRRGPKVKTSNNKITKQEGKDND